MISAPQTAGEGKRLESDEAQPAPDVSSDRVPSPDPKRVDSLDKAKTAPLEIQEIENLEDDAKGG